MPACIIAGKAVRSGRDDMTMQRAVAGVIIFICVLIAVYSGIVYFFQGSQTTAILTAITGALIAEWTYHRSFVKE